MQRNNERGKWESRSEELENVWDRSGYKVDVIVTLIIQSDA